MNIMLNDYCNLNCKYCFAGLNEKKINISDENMQSFIEFLKRSNMRSLRVLGGEPTLHPNFIKYIQTATMDRFFEEILVFTNGYNLNKEMVDNIISPKIGFLINFNKIDDIGEKKYNAIVENVTYLTRKYRQLNLPVKVTLGINIYEPDFDYKYIINMTKQLNLKSIRYSITVPTKTGENITLDYYKQYIPKIMEFLECCYQNKIVTNLDCNNIPKCLFTKDELITLVTRGHNMCNKNFCSMPLDVRPNLDVTRCFPFFDTWKLNIKDYDNVNQIKEFFGERIDKYRFEKPTFKECETCKLFENKLCQCGCLTYKFKKGDANDIN